MNFEDSITAVSDENGAHDQLVSGLLLLNDQNF